MRKKMFDFWPPMRMDFNRAVDRRREPRASGMIFDIVFREVPLEHARTALQRKSSEGN